MVILILAPNFVIHFKQLIRYGMETILITLSRIQHLLCDQSALVAVGVSVQAVKLHCSKFLVFNWGCYLHSVL